MTTFMLERKTQDKRKLYMAQEADGSMSISLKAGKCPGATEINNH
jgi:hypothetical protein